MAALKAISEASGEALEYAPFELNIYHGCPHGCSYCFVPGTKRTSRDEFKQNETQIKKVTLENLEYDLKNWRGERSTVHLCFLCDPYPIGRDTTKTRKCLELLRKYDHPFQILTKGGLEACRDFDLYEPPVGGSFGVTLTFDNPEDSKKNEPGAALPADRIKSLKIAHEKGITTWVSLEPVIDPAQTLNLIDLTHEFVDFYGVGKLNHNAELERTIDWLKFRTEAETKLQGYGKDYKNYKIKTALKKATLNFDKKVAASINFDAIVRYLGHSNNIAIKSKKIGEDGQQEGHFTAVAIDKAEDFIALRNGKRQLWINLQQLKADINGKYISYKDIESYKNIYIDLDCEKPEGFKDYAATEEERSKALSLLPVLKEWLQSHGLRCGLDIHSGNGCGMILPILEIKAEPVFIARFATFLKMVKSEIPSADSAMFDPPRVIGIPRTLNAKLETADRKNQMREVVGPIPERVEDQGLLDFINSLEPDPVALATYQAKYNNDADSEPESQKEEIGKDKEPLSEDAKSRLQELFLEDPGFKARLFEPDVKDRSRQEHYLCARLWEGGFSEVEIYQVMEFSPQTKWLERTDSYKRSTIQKAIKKSEANKKEKANEEAKGVKDSKPKKDKPDDKGKEKPKESAATVMVNLAKRDGTEFWHTPKQDFYVTFRKDGHKETHLIRSTATKLWLGTKFFEKKSIAPNVQAVQDATAVLEGLACYNGSEYEVYVRVGPYMDRVYVDLGSPDWKAIEITSDGWKVVDEAPIKFWRPKTMLPLPIPERGGNWNDLRNLANAKEKRTWIQSIAWLVQAYWPKGPYSFLNFGGEQGSGKTLLQVMLKMVADPSVTVLRRPPKDEKDLMIAAANERLPSFDNLSGMPEHLSDAFCGLSNGASLGTRMLYSNGEEHVLSARRPCVMNGIDTLTTRGDLLDRTMINELSKITEDDRKQEARIMVEFEKCRPKLLGLLLDATVVGLKRQSEIVVDKLPRMADFCIWVIACEPSLPWIQGEFLEEYKNARKDAYITLADSDQVAKAVYDLAILYETPKVPWTGTATELLETLERNKGIVYNHVPKGWPRTAGVLSNRLNRAAPALRSRGVNIEKRSPDKNTKLIEISFRRSPTQANSSASEKNQDAKKPSDGSDASGAKTPTSSVEKTSKIRGEGVEGTHICHVAGEEIGGKPPEPSEPSENPSTHSDLGSNSECVGERRRPSEPSQAVRHAAMCNQVVRRACRGEFMTKKGKSRMRRRNRGNLLRSTTKHQKREKAKASNYARQAYDGNEDSEEEV